MCGVPFNPSLKRVRSIWGSNCKACQEIEVDAIRVADEIKVEDQ